MESTDKREFRQRIAEKVCEAIEDQFGRLSLLIVDNTEFTKNRMRFTEKALNSKHIDEFMGCTFIELVQSNMKKG